MWMLTDSEGFVKSVCALRVRCLARGAIIGLAVGIVWSFLLKPFTDELGSLGFSFFLCTAGLTLAGTVVGMIRRLPGCVGTVLGGVCLSVVAIIVGPKDGWIVPWIMVFGIAGSVGGSIIGGIFYSLRPDRKRGRD